VSKLKLLAGIMILSLINIILVGCAGHPGGLNRPRQLTDDEKAEVIEIALNTPEVQQKLETKSHYTTEINWLAVTWNGSKWSAYYHVDSNWENDPNLKNVPGSAAFYPYVLIHFMEPAAWQIATAVDLDTGKVVLVHEYPASKGPIQSGSYSLEIRMAPIHEVQINIAESYPPQVMLYIKGGLSDGCTTFHEITKERDGNTINIRVTTQRPKDVMCTQVYDFFEKNLNLGSDFISGEKYIIQVNDTTHIFVMQ